MEYRNLLELTNMALWRAAEATIDTLRDLGMEDVCFIGGLAARLHGNDREPNDVDILILDSHHDQETIKWMMAEENPCFYLVDAKTPGADWTVLWYHPHGEGSTRRPAAIKIDILLPGIMDLPSFDPSFIDFDNSRSLPAAPILLVLLHKVRGWWERFHSPNDYQHKKHWDDACDVANLAPLASQMGVTIHDDVLPDDFIYNASEWVNEFIAEYPKFRTRYHWRKLGYRTNA